MRQELYGDIKPFLENEYKVFEGICDLFAYFYEKGVSLLKKKGQFGFISNTFDKIKTAKSLRSFLADEITIKKYIDFTEVQIFEGATTYPVILVAKNTVPKENSFEYIKIPKREQSSVIDINIQKAVSVFQDTLEGENWSFKSSAAVFLVSKIQKNETVRKKYGKCYYGVKTALNEAFIIPE